MGKEFNKKYMHPTRRKLVDMVQTGKYDKNTQLLVGLIKEKLVKLVMFGKTNITDTRKKKVIP